MNSLHQQIKWVLFDFDGTLIDFNGASKRSFKKCFEDRGIDFRDAYYSCYQKHNHAAWQLYEKGEIDSQELRFRRFDLTGRELKMDLGDPIAFNTSYFKGLVHFAEPLPQAQDLLDHLRNRYKISIITNGMKEVQRPRIAALNWTDRFHCITVSDEIGVAKPAGAYFDHVMKVAQLPYKKSEILVVGDNLYSDIKGGINYGLPTCWFNPNGASSPPDIQADYTISSLEELQEML